MHYFNCEVVIVGESTKDCCPKFGLLVNITSEMFMRFVEIVSKMPPRQHSQYKKGLNSP